MRWNFSRLVRNRSVHEMEMARARGSVIEVDSGEENDPKYIGCLHHLCKNTNRFWPNILKCTMSVTKCDVIVIYLIDELLLR